MTDLFDSKDTMFSSRNKDLMRVMNDARMLKGLNVPILISGPTGCGKEIMAKFLHTIEDSPTRPFIPVNCSAIPDPLLESILFGHMKGSFSGAISDHRGKFEAAHGGDIFLDEIGTLSLTMQTKLLRVIQEKEIDKIGGRKPISLRFRLIAATNENLDLLVKEGRFREDLFHRINVFNLKLPSLDKRAEDIPAFIDLFLEKYSVIANKILLPSSISMMTRQNWPGNIRQLENTIQRLLIFTAKDPLEYIPHETVIKELTYLESQEEAQLRKFENSCMNYTKLKSAVIEFERKIISSTLHKCKFNKSKTALALGIARNSLYRKFEVMGLEF